MTTLAITPNWKNKSAKFKGTVAAGEHVSVTIQNENGEGGEFIEDVSTLRLRVVDPCNGRTLAIFPEPVPEGETPEEWNSDLSPLRCTLNLNTVQMLKAVPPAANVPLLWVLDDYENKTLYFKEQFPVEHWPRLRGEEEPTDLDDYKDIIADFSTRLTTAEQTVADAAANAQNAAASASAAAASAATAATAATDAQAGAIASKNAAQTAANDAASAKTAAETAQGKAEEAQEAAETAQGKAQEYAEAAAESAAAFVVDDTFSVEGAAADAKAVGEANQDLITQINTVQDNLDAEVTARETLAAAVGDNRQNLAAEIARAQGAEQSLDNRKADKTAVAAAIQAEASRAQTAEQGLRSDVSSAQTAIADRYTKSEVDAKIAGVQTFGKAVVQTLPDLADADDRTIYLVPRADSEAPDLCDEYVVVEESGVRRWERIGAKAVDPTLDNTVTRISSNGVKSSGIWSAIWGALASLPTGFSSLYDWCVDQLAGKASTADATLVNASDWVCSPAKVGGVPVYIVQHRSGAWYPSDGEGGTGAVKGDAQSLSLSWAADEWYGGVALTATRVALGGYVLGSQTDKPLASEAEAAANRAAISALSDTKADKSDVDPLLFAQYYPEGNVKSAAEFTPGIKYDAPDTVNRTITVKPFCNTGDSENDNSNLSGRVVIPPFVDASGNGYISDDGTRFKIVGVSGFVGNPNTNTSLTAIVAPTTVTDIRNGAFTKCSSLTAASFPVVTTVGSSAFESCYSLAAISLPAVTTVRDFAFYDCFVLTVVSFPAATSIEDSALAACPSLTSVDFGDTPRLSVPSLGSDAFTNVPATCKIIVPDAQYDAWIAADGWSDLVTAGYKFLRHSEWEYARKYEVDKKADKPATFTAGNLAALDANGNPTDSGVKASDKLDSTSAAPAFDATATYDVGKHVVYNGRLYRCTTAVTTAGPWNAANWTADDMTSPDATLDITAQNQLRVIAKDGTVLWAQGYDLASTSSATLACDAVNNFTFADGATTQAFALPTAPTGKVGDFGLDVDNSANASAATMTLTGLDTIFSVVVPKGESLNNMLAIAAGELARFYITLTTFRVNNLPTWHIVKQVVENGGATA